MRSWGHLADGIGTTLTATKGYPPSDDLARVVGLLAQARSICVDRTQAHSRLLRDLRRGRHHLEAQRRARERHPLFEVSAALTGKPAGAVSRN